MPIAKIKIFDSKVILQKGEGCTYFSIDGARMLATPPDRDYAPNLMEYMKKNGKKNENVFEEKNIKYIQSDSLPTRFIRGSHIIDDWKGERIYIKGLNSTVFNSPEKNTIVNKKGETAETSIRKNLDTQDTPSVSSVSNPSTPNKKIFNRRMESKMRKHKESVMNFIQDKDVLSAEFF